MAHSAPTLKDPLKTAKQAGLLYVHDSKPGIERRKAGKGFSYWMPGGERVTSEEVLDRIHGLRIPPAWTDVWICLHANGHLQATGRDDRGRKQYLYHPDWRQARDETKYHRMLIFAEALPKIRNRISRDLDQKGMTRERVLAAIVKIMEKTLIRVGNEEYARDNKSFGLTTIHNDHAEVDGSAVHFQFKGKSGVFHDVEFSHPRVAKVVRKCQDLPGQELFAYLDEAGKAHDLGSADVNAYLKEVTGEDITAKDFRTWFGTVHALQALQACEPCDNQTALKKNVVSVVDEVANLLRNTRAVCKKSYIHPGLFECYMAGKPLEFKCDCKQKTSLKDAEHELLHFLQKSM